MNVPHKVTHVHVNRSELLNSVLEQGTPFSRWDSHTLLAWLEVWVGVPFWYIAAIRNCLQSGKMLAVSGLCNVQPMMSLLYIDTTYDVIAVYRCNL